MADTGTTTKAESLLEKMAALVEAADAEAERRKRQVDQAIAALAAAETAAKAELNSKRRLYQINYRIKDVKVKTKGTADQRRTALVAMIESLKPSENHTSTSTWIVRLHIKKAATVLGLLKGPVSSFDYLAVAQIDSNRAKFGDANLQ
ncbi:hypothetical protein DSM25558_4515 [Agrobacterium sp. DSM 25558]|uniref:hypothetical protein n=1 Tax=Agrobacterium sp. DSM 25558 TaxID=1907665 RepID=UPI0009724ED5|nr:hypothetical protein [Agrobacterium sp. DSM 25558]SCX28604.1 hypothetical protein DSM25558_4515 [Agrobacterium sp. DSM 25558]